jgi:anti-sigma factor RsiW
MRSGFAFGRGAILMKTPSARQQVLRRRLAVACAVMGLALASGLLGSMIHPAAASSKPAVTGPFSYFPS